jgi:hypothetical protein
MLSARRAEIAMQQLLLSVECVEPDQPGWQKRQNPGRWLAAGVF